MCHLSHLTRTHAWSVALYRHTISKLTLNPKLNNLNRKQVRWLDAPAGAGKDIVGKEQSLDPSGWRDDYVCKILEQAVSAKKGSAGGLRQSGTGRSGAAGSAVSSSSC